MTAALKKSGPFYALLAAAAIGATYYVVVWTEASRMAGYWGGSLTAQWATSFKLFVHYLRLALVPYPLLADYTGVFPISTGFMEPETLVCMLISAAYLGLAVWLLRHQPPVTLGMGWFLVPLLPVLQIVGFHEIAADHFLYLPMLGVALVFGHLGALAASSRNTSVLAWASLLAVFALCSILTVSRNRVWANQLALWEDTYEKAPGSYRANANLGQLYWTRFERGPNRNSQLRERAIQLLERAAELDPTDSLPLSNLGAIYREWGWDEVKKGEPDVAEKLERRALGYLSRAVSLDPEDVWAYSNLGDVRKDLGLIWSRRANPVQAETERQLAIEAYRKAISLGSPNPRFPLVYFKLAMVKVDQRRFEEAVPWLENSSGRPVWPKCGSFPTGRDTVIWPPEGSLLPFPISDGLLISSLTRPRFVSWPMPWKRSEKQTKQWPSIGRHCAAIRSRTRPIISWVWLFGGWGGSARPDNTCCVPGNWWRGSLDHLQPMHFVQESSESWNS